MYSHLILVGRLGNDAELRYTPQGAAVVNFSLATTRHFTKNGEKTKETTWYKVTVWGKLGESVAPYLLKGTEVLVEGELIPDENGNPPTYKAKDGSTKAEFRVRCNSLRLIGEKKESKVENSEEL